MAFQAVPDGALAVVKFGTDLLPFTNTFWFTKTAFDNDDMINLAADVDTTWGAGIRAILHDTMNYIQTQVYDERYLGGGVEIALAHAGAGGISTGDAAATSTACVLTLRTANRGRAGRGRVYVSGMGEAGFAANVWGSYVTDAIEAAFLAMNVAVLLDGWQPVVVSRQLDKVARTTPLAQPVTSWQVRNAIPASQRRRPRRP